MNFPKDFIWGAATAAYQIEGGGLEDGRGECIWTRFSHTPGMIREGHTGDIACDHYHRYPEDVQLMKSLGLNGYRFSVAWARVLPQGTGQPNPLGLDFYDRLVDELLAAGIQPYLTLYHWDLPQALQDRGGWENPDSPQWFAEYTALMTSRLGDRVKHWTTHNEPRVASFAGNWQGRHAPGNYDLALACRVAHHLLLAHGAAVPVIRQQVPDARAGIVLDLYAVSPITPADEAAAKLFDSFQNRWFLDPVMRGQYPTDMVEVLGDILHGIDVEAVKAAQVPLDYLGINYYMRRMVRAVSGGILPFEDFTHPDNPQTQMGWEIYPDGLYQWLMRLHKEYQVPTLYVTENGAAFADPEPVNNTVNDPERVLYLQEHFAAAARAIAEEVPLKGYFVWSLMDNFEWAWGYTRRFGIVYVDYATQKRTLKQSARYYQDLIHRQRA
ncbi:MAG: beta-glucosidase [Anaerolineales bacterium]|nr:beta-glucosidase [Anaerolineales bacterium]